MCQGPLFCTVAWLSLHCYVSRCWRMAPRSTQQLCCCSSFPRSGVTLHTHQPFRSASSMQFSFMLFSSMLFGSMLFSSTYSFGLQFVGSCESSPIFADVIAHCCPSSTAFVNLCHLRLLFVAHFAGLWQQLTCGCSSHAWKLQAGLKRSYVASQRFIGCVQNRRAAGAQAVYFQYPQPLTANFDADERDSHSKSLIQCCGH